MYKILKKQNNKNFIAGFTLIEIIVVIAIIGVLSAVVTAFLNSARDKGRIAAGMQFEANTYHSIGDQMVGEWKFDDKAGLALDTSGYGNNGTVGSGVTWVSNGGYDGKGTYKFANANYNGSYIYLNNSPILNIGRPGGSFTISAWIKYSSTNDWNTIFWESEGNGFAVSEGKVIQFNIYPNTNKLNLSFYKGYNLSNKSVPSNRWSYVAVTYIGATKQASFYIDGVLDSTITTDAVPNMSPSYTCAIIGTRYCDKIYSDVNGMIDNVRVYSAAISSASIQQLYVEGLQTHQDLALIK